MTQQCLSSLNDIAVDEAREQTLATCAKALAHPARIRLLRILTVSDSCLGSDLVEQLGLAQSTVSEHLRILREAGFIHAEVQHPRTCFSLNTESVAQFRALLDYL